MNDTTVTTLFFVAFLLGFTMVGLISVLKSRGTRHDYYLANASVAPWLVGLSAVATNNSGYMFIGVIGYTYVAGLSSIWLLIGWISGDFLASLFVHTRLRIATERSNEVSYAGVLSRWYGDSNNHLQRLIGIISLLFLLSYAAAQLMAGSKALQVLFGWPGWAGAAMGATLVVAYCFAGGIRASIWTDAAQSLVMMLAMAMLLFITLKALGGMQTTVTEMREVPGFLDWYPDNLALPGLAGGLLFAISWLFAGLSVIGQPHIMVRFMTLKEVGTMHRARAWYYIWFLIFYCMATAVGMLSRVYLVDPGNFDAELALPTMAVELLPPALVGLIMAGIFAATISTADSLVLSCSAAITHDLAPRTVKKTWLIKCTTLAITVCALGLALSNNQSVFNLVILAWSGLASAFAPLLISRCLNWRVGEGVSIFAVLAGLLVALLWRYLGWHEEVYEGLPGMLTGFCVLFLHRLSREVPLLHRELVDADSH